MDDQPGFVQRPTVIDVARVAGVSPSTVSNFLNGRDVLRPETRERVEAAIASLGYERSVAARGLRTRSMPVLGLLIEDDSRLAMRDPVHAQFLAGLLEGARERGLGVSVVATAPGDSDRTIIRFVTSGHAAAVALSIQGPEGSRAELLGRLAATGVPIILFERRDAPPGLGWIASDNEGGAAALYEHLRDLGHRRMLYLGSAVPWAPGERRRDTFLACAERDGTTVDVVLSPDWTTASAEAAARSALPGRMVTAVAAANDHLAAGVLTAAHALGIAVPGDLSLVGFSDLEIAVQLTPKLTTVGFDPALEGELAAAWLIARLDGTTPDAGHLVPATLRVRDSTAEPPAAHRSRGIATLQSL